MKEVIGHIRRARAAFTLMEVNLAIFIMAVGVLAMTSLYPLGFRESQQARDDGYAAVVADEVLGQLTAALSSRNITWDRWKNAVGSAVGASDDGGREGWFSYLTKRGDDYVAISRDSANEKAGRVFKALAEACSGATEVPKWNPDRDYAHGLVVRWGKRVVATRSSQAEALDDHSRVSISFRMSRRSGALMTAPIYYTEVHFQGDQKEQDQ